MKFKRDQSISLLLSYTLRCIYVESLLSYCEPQAYSSLFGNEPLRPGES